MVPGDVPGPVGGYLVLGDCTWSKGEVYLVWGVYLVLGGVPGPRGCTWSQGGVPGPRGCTWSQGVPGPKGGVPGPGVVYLVPGIPDPGGMYLVWGVVPGPGGVPGQVLPPVNRITHTCKNKTLPQLRCGR